MKKEKQITKYRQMGSRNKKTGKLSYYTVTSEDHKKFKCECLGFQYRSYKDCRHITRLKHLLCIKDTPEGGGIKVGDKIEYKIYYSVGFESNYKKTSSTTKGVVTQLLKSGYKVESDSGSRTISIVKKSDIINQQ